MNRRHHWLQILLTFQTRTSKIFFLELQGKKFTQERGFEPSMVLGKEIWPLVRYHTWGYFSVTLKDPAIIPIVQEFYASFRGRGSSGDHTMLSGKWYSYEA
ncbi:hypothetical protein PVK06_027100 [Gossypium arboreum]|uniref:Uncharacterized protein n=1 Tax=Gossypium arboreum TaxID=29729 RepID=A0ABR0P1Z3_GOSAR|nr:hypothetical protein PVK06_027100 [Gossypium arboreum]